MRHEILTALPLLVMPVVLVFMMTRKKVIRTFEGAGATSQGAALPDSDFTGLRGWWIRRLERAGAVRRSGTRVWLDAPAWQAYHRVRRIRGMSIAFTLLAVLGVMVWVGIFD
ncbi:MAG: hypothetical protein AB7O67_12055 [Vicinamibacterales bacterium]